MKIKNDKSIIAIGIDLGTTYSCVSIWQNNRAVIIPNQLGAMTTPSVVAFTPTEHLVGETAAYQAASNPVNTIFAVKRIIGRKYSDPYVQSCLSNWPYEVKNISDKPAICIKHKHEALDLHPEQISAMVLAELRDTAERYLGFPVNDAVITVPAYFTDLQRQATKTAGIIAGLNVHRLINEPTAAAIAYGIDLKDSRTVLVYDLGGGTLDISLLQAKDGEFNILAVGGNSSLGGEDFDNLIVEHMADIFQDKHHIDLRKNISALVRLRDACEKAKRLLVDSVCVDIQVYALHNQIDFNEKLTRAKFDSLIQPLITNSLDEISKVLKDAKMQKHQVDDILLVGGSSRILKIHSMVKEYFGKEPSRAINPDEAVAAGAAIVAEMFCTDSKLLQRNIVIQDVVPLTLGIKVISGELSVVIPRNTAYPVCKSRPYYTVHNNQTEIRIEVFEGERKMVKDNHKLGETILGSIPKAKAGEQDIKVEFCIDQDGILNVKASKNESIAELTVENLFGRHNTEKVEEMIELARKFRLDDEERAKKAKARADLEILLERAHYDLRDQEIREELQKFSQWMENNPDSTRQEYERKKGEVEALLATL